MDDPLTTLKVRDLRAIARTYQLRGRSKRTTKAALVAFIREHLTADQIEKAVAGKKPVARTRKKKTSTSQSTVELADMPAEMMWEIMYNLPPRDALHVCATQKGAHEICQTDTFWLQKIQRDFGELFELSSIPSENRLETYKQYWKEAKGKLVSCAEDGHLKCIVSLLRIGVNPDIPDKLNKTALMKASWKGHADIVRLLMEHDANPNLRDKSRGETALMEASKWRHREIVALLLDHGAAPDIQDEWKNTALIIASWFGHVDIVRLLLDHNADPNSPNKRRDTALIMASEEGHPDIVRLLLERGATSNLQDVYGNTALMRASEEGYTEHTDIVQLLLEHGADPDLQDKGGNSAIMIANKGGHMDIVALLKPIVR